MKHVLYILYSHKKDRYYIGSTSDNISDRIKKHNTNHSGYTGGLGDWVLMYSQEFDTVNEARKREFQIKKWKSRKLIEALISKAQLV